jgi:hypothetical protein
LREDQWVIGEPNRDPADLARDATVTASGTQPPAIREADRTVTLDEEVGIRVPAADALDTVRLRVSSSRATALDVEVWSEGRPENYVPHERANTAVVDVPPGGPRWVDVPIEADPAPGQGVFLVLNANPDVELYATERELSGVIASTRRPDESHRLVPGAREFHWPPTGWVPCFDLDPSTGLYDPGNVVDGYSRPYGLPHGWLSPPVEAVREGDRTRLVGETTLTLEWEAPREVAAVALAFNTALTPWYNSLTPMDETDVPECVRDYTIQYRDDDGWRDVATVSGNYRRFRRHTFDPVTTDALRIDVEATNGVPWAEIFEVRAYGPDVWPPLEDV